MWKEYKKRFLVTQIIIGIVVLVAWQYGMDRRQLLMAAVAMEAGSVLGAVFGARLKRQIEAADDDLPLKK